MVRVSKTFQELRELVRIVSIAGPQEGLTLSLKTIAKSQSPYARLFRALHENPGLNEGSSFRDIFPVEAEAGPAAQLQQISEQRSDGRNRKVKSRLKTRLLNTLFVLNLADAGYSVYSQTLYSVNRTVFLCRVLRVFGARELSVPFGRSGLSKAMIIEEWSCALEFLSILRIDAARRGASKAHRVYAAQAEHCHRLREAEEAAEICVENLQIAFVKSGGEKPAHATEAVAGAEIVGRLSEQFPSFKLSFLALRLRALASQLRMDYLATVKLCDDALELLKQYPIFSNHARIGEYALMGLISSIQGHNHEAVSRYIELCEKHLDKREDNWLNFKEFQYLHLMHSLAFKDAFRLVQDILSNTRYEIQAEAVHDRWSLFRLNAEFATGARVPVTKYEDFAALVPSLTADKAGLNTSMILLHILLLAERKQFGELRDRIEFIRGYRKRHLKGAENSQMNRFFKMLELIETCDLNYIKIVRKSRTLLEELKQSEANEPIQGEQILPATWIWNYLMEQLREYHPVNTRMG